MYLEKFKLDGRTAVVTGGGQGIGLACAEALGEAGARIVIADRDPAMAETGLAGLKAKGYAADIRHHGRHRFGARRRGRGRARKTARQGRHPGQQCRHCPERNAGGKGRRRALAERHRRQPQRHLLVLPRLRPAHARRRVGLHRQYRLDVGLHRQQAAGAELLQRLQGRVHHLTKSLAAEWGDARRAGQCRGADLYRDAAQRLRAQQSADVRRLDRRHARWPAWARSTRSPPSCCSWPPTRPA